MGSWSKVQLVQILHKLLITARPITINFTVCHAVIIPSRSPFLCQFQIFGTIEPLTIVIGQFTFGKKRLFNSFRRTVIKRYFMHFILPQSYIFNMIYSFRSSCQVPLGKILNFAGLVTGCEITKYASPTKAKDRFNGWRLQCSECQRIMTFVNRRSTPFCPPSNRELETPSPRLRSPGRYLENWANS